MDSPAPACPSKQQPDASTTLELDAGVKPKLPDACTMFKLDAGVKPKLPDTCSKPNLEPPGIKPKLPDACTTLELDTGVKPKLPGACPQLNLELRGACAKIKLEAGIEPKPEPCEEDSAPLPPQAWDAAADDWEITPVSGNHPFFTTVLSRSQVQKSFQLTIPTRFQRHLPEVRVPAVLLCRGMSWETRYCGDLKCKKLDAAWRDFAVDNRLRVGDACVFELVGAETGAEARKGVVFRVQVLRGGLPEEVTSKGATSDEPLVIVD